MTTTKHQYQEKLKFHSKLVLLWPVFIFYIPWKHKKLKVFCSGGTKWEHWLEMSYEYVIWILKCLFRQFNLVLLQASNHLFKVSNRNFLFSNLTIKKPGSVPFVEVDQAFVCWPGTCFDWQSFKKNEYTCKIRMLWLLFISELKFYQTQLF